MKITTSHKPTPPSDYPWIGQTQSGVVVLFWKPKSGMCVACAGSPGTYREGYVSESWAEDEFLVFNGAVTLEND